MAPAGQLKVLVVEDNADLRQFLFTALKSHGLEVSVAEAGRAALDLLNTGYRPDLLVADLCLPGMETDDFLSSVRAIDGLAGVKTLIVSGSDELSIRSKELSAHGYLRKPFTLDRLFAAVEAAVRAP